MFNQRINSPVYTYRSSGESAKAIPRVAGSRITRGSLVKTSSTCAIQSEEEIDQDHTFKTETHQPGQSFLFRWSTINADYSHHNFLILSVKYIHAIVQLSTVLNHWTVSGHCTISKGWIPFSKWSSKTIPCEALQRKVIFKELMHSFNRLKQTASN